MKLIKSNEVQIIYKINGIIIGNLVKEINWTASYQSDPRIRTDKDNKQKFNNLLPLKIAVKMDVIQQSPPVEYQKLSTSAVVANNPGGVPASLKNIIYSKGEIQWLINYLPATRDSVQEIFLPLRTLPINLSPPLECKWPPDAAGGDKENGNSTMTRDIHFL